MRLISSSERTRSRCFARPGGCRSWSGDVLIKRWRDAHRKKVLAATNICLRMLRLAEAPSIIFSSSPVPTLVYAPLAKRGEKREEVSRIGGRARLVLDVAMRVCEPIDTLPEQCARTCRLQYREFCFATIDRTRSRACESEIIGYRPNFRNGDRCRERNRRSWCRLAKLAGRARPCPSSASHLSPARGSVRMAKSVSIPYPHDSNAILFLSSENGEIEGRDMVRYVHVTQLYQWLGGQHVLGMV